jgi:hypothetical protein
MHTILDSYYFKCLVLNFNDWTPDALGIDIAVVIYGILRKWSFDLVALYFQHSFSLSISVDGDILATLLRSQIEIESQCSVFVNIDVRTQYQYGIVILE